MNRMALKNELKRETIKWKSKLEERLQGLQAQEGAEAFIRNITAYCSDVDHFLENDDLIRAFECVVYAWGMLKTLERLEVVTSTLQRSAAQR
ncbi:MAG: DUF357 domain-containing protein [Methanocellales archaeon]|nr:DUF357 domain-containing protein [Methanocellales archaeon]